MSTELMCMLLVLHSPILDPNNAGESMFRRLHSDLDVTMTLTSEEATHTPKLATSIHCTQQPFDDKGCCMKIQH